MARVLKPNGIIALSSSSPLSHSLKVKRADEVRERLTVWNLEDRSVQWVAELRDSYEKHEAGTPQARLGLWKSIFETDFYAQTYEEAELEQFHRNLPSNEQGVVDRILSKSYITALSEEEQQKVAQEMREIVKKGEGKKWINEKEGTFGKFQLSSLFRSIGCMILTVFCRDAQNILTTLISISSERRLEEILFVSSYLSSASISLSFSYSGSSSKAPFVRPRNVLTKLLAWNFQSFAINSPSFPSFVPRFSNISTTSSTR